MAFGHNSESAKADFVNLLARGFSRQGMSDFVNLPARHFNRQGRLADTDPPLIL